MRRGADDAGRRQLDPFDGRWLQRLSFPGARGAGMGLRLAVFEALQHGGVVDFGSTDDSKSIVSRYAANDHRIKFHEIPVCTLPGFW